MLWHCDTLTLGPASRKFQWLADHVNFDRVPHDYVYELAVVLATPGVTAGDIRNWFEGRLQKRTIRFVQGLGLDVGVAGAQNARSVTEADAWAMLRLTPPRHNPSVWARALLVGRTDVELARRVGLPVSHVQSWRGRPGRSIET